MENTELMNPLSAELLEKVLVNGDLATLTPAQRLDYYRQVCQSCGLNPLTRPFDYIRLNGKLTLYARKDATDQLRKIHGVSIDDADIQETDKLFRVKVKGHTRDNRSDVEIGVVSKTDMQGNIANAEMKAVTKAKRRFTLSICGLGWLDETEIESIPKSQVQTVIVDENGEIMGEFEARNDSKRVLPQTQKNTHARVEKPVEAQEKGDFDADAFLSEFSRPTYVQSMSREAAEAMTDRNNQPYGEKSTFELFQMLNSISRVAKKATTDEQKEAYALKVSAICEILMGRKLDRQIVEERPNPFVKGENND